MTTQTVKVQLTEQGLNEDDIRRRDEEETFVVSTVRTLLKKRTVGKHLFPTEKLWT